MRDVAAVAPAGAVGPDGPVAGVRLSDVSRAKATLALAGVLAVVVASFQLLGVNPFDTLAAFPEFGTFFVERFMPPNLSAIGQQWHLIVQTLWFAVAATFVSSALATLCALVMSEVTNPVAWTRVALRTVLSVFRNVPMLVWATLLIFVFGIGPMVGLIAIILAMMGFLARSYADSLTSVAGSKIEALKASGASRRQILCHGIFPEFVPAWLNWTLFTFELNLRASAILGMVGAGGIGLMISANISLFRFRDAMGLVLALVVMILATELATNALRKRIR